MEQIYQIITFYEFKYLGGAEKLAAIKESLTASMRANFIYGTIILAAEGFNSTVCGAPGDIEKFVAEIELILETKIEYKSSAHAARSFQKRKVKIKPEIVTLKKSVKVAGEARETHVSSAADWNEIISDADTFVLDARNDYEFRVGTFVNAVNPRIEKFSDLPAFVRENLDSMRHRKIAMFCTGGIRCEKFAPYLLDLGFEKVYQLSGGILKYLEEVPENKSLWRGECFVFDERTTLNENLKKGTERDLSAELKRRKNPR